MTKYILIGGYLYKAKDGCKSFFEELLKDCDKSRPVKILNCLFARPKDSWDNKFKENKEFFSKHINNFEFILAELEKFVEQVKTSDIIFLQGGYTDSLLKMLLAKKEWIQYLDGKTVVGTSAGGDVVAKYYSIFKTDSVGSGLGLVPIKFISHWQSDYSDEEISNVDWEAEFKKIKDFGEDLPIYTLAEGEFAVFNI